MQMEIQYFGGNYIKINTKKSTIIIDPVSDIAKLKFGLKKVDTLMVTNESLRPTDGVGSFMVDTPGEYEFIDHSIKGIAAQPHTSPSGDNSATMYRLQAGDLRVLIVGHVAPSLSENQLESIGVVDVVVIPVGGGGYTLDSTGAATIVRSIEPKLVIPVHYNDSGIPYEVPQAEVDLFTKELGAPVAEPSVDKLKIKSLPEQMTVQIINRS